MTASLKASPVSSKVVKATEAVQKLFTRPHNLISTRSPGHYSFVSNGSLTVEFISKRAAGFVPFFRLPRKVAEMSTVASTKVGLKLLVLL